MGRANANANANANPHGQPNGVKMNGKSEIEQRDIFIAWIRGEFAAANAIIDALCNHLKEVGDSGEYDAPLRCIQQRRLAWLPLLRMQHYYSVADVAHSLRQVAVSKVSTRRFEARRSQSQHRYKIENISARSVSNSHEFPSSTTSSDIATDSTDGDSPGRLEFNMKEVNVREVSDMQTLNKAEDGFEAKEMVDGQLINVVKGLKLHENVFDSTELSQLTKSVEEFQRAGQQGTLKGQTYVVSKRPMKGNGREMIQFGIPVVTKQKGQSDEAQDVVEPIPKAIGEIIERLLQKNVISNDKRPDCCIVNFFYEGDYSQPHLSPHNFERPFYTVPLLSESTVVLGRGIVMDGPGNYTGPLKLSVSPGSMLCMQGNSVEIAKHAICSAPEKRVIVTLVKLKQKNHHDPLSLLANGAHPQTITKEHLSAPPQSNGNNLSASQHSNGNSTSQAFSGRTGPTSSYPHVAVLTPGWSQSPKISKNLGLGTGVFLPSGESACDQTWPFPFPPQKQGVIVLSQMLPRCEYNIFNKPKKSLPGQLPYMQSNKSVEKACSQLSEISMSMPSSGAVYTNAITNEDQKAGSHGIVNSDSITNCDTKEGSNGAVCTNAISDCNGILGSNGTIHANTAVNGCKVQGHNEVVDTNSVTNGEKTEDRNGIFYSNAITNGEKTQGSDVIEYGNDITHGEKIQDSNGKINFIALPNGEKTHDNNGISYADSNGNKADYIREYCLPEKEKRISRDLEDNCFSEKVMRISSCLDVNSNSSADDKDIHR